MPTSRELTNLVINKVENNQVYNYMKANGFVNDDELYFVEGSCSISDIDGLQAALNLKADKSEIPTVNNGTLTIQKNGTTVKTFTANSSSNVTADITVPTKVSELTNDAGYITTDNNTTYTFATGDGNGQIKVTPSSGSAQNVSVKGLGSAAYTASTNYIAATTKGAANGVAELDSNGKVPTSQLPSYVDDVIEGTLSAFPATGETGKIYVDTSTNKTYRWSGSTYTEISASLALGETSSTAYRGDRGKIAYDHSQSTHARTDATKVASSSTNGNIKINDTETTVYTLPTASSSVSGGIKVGSNLSMSNGTLSVPTASGTQAGVTIVYPADSCTTFTSDSGTCTPAAVRKAVGMFDPKTHTHASGDITGLGAAADKNVDTSISAGSTSTNLPTSKAVATFVEGKGYKTTDTNYYHTTGSWSGLKYTATANGGAGELAFTIPTGKTSTTVAIGNHTHTIDELDGGTDTWIFNCGTATTVLD